MCDDAVGLDVPYDFLYGKVMLEHIMRQIRCSRPFLALHVLCGQPVMYRMTISGPLLIDDRNAGARIVKNTVVCG